jgi:hypothetical protein
LVQVEGYQEERQRNIPTTTQENFTLARSAAPCSCAAKPAWLDWPAAKTASASRQWAMPFELSFAGTLPALPENSSQPFVPVLTWQFCPGKMQPAHLDARHTHLWLTAATAAWYWVSARSNIPGHAGHLSQVDTAQHFRYHNIAGCERDPLLAGGISRPDAESCCRTAACPSAFNTQISQTGSARWRDMGRACRSFSIPTST